MFFIDDMLTAISRRHKKLEEKGELTDENIEKVRKEELQKALQGLEFYHYEDGEFKKCTK